jgi:futalosine hydrolase
VILVVCAVAQELAFLAPRPGVDVLVAGIGPVESGLAVARRLARGDVALVVDAGIAGGFPERAAVGDAVVVVRERYADIGLEGGGALSLPDGAELTKTVAADLVLAGRLAEAGLTAGDGLTSACVTTTDARMRRFAEAYDPTVESMEGFAVLRAAALAGIPAVEVRGVSNRVGDRARGGWDIRAGIRATERALDALFTILERPQP